MKTVSDIRNEFLGFFKSKGHTIVPSSSLVPHNDPTLMFTNSGMVQFKDVFTGREKRDYKRAASAQKCARAGGKHNDLDNVGYTARHHTFFEMLGNFSFGDYFKDDAIAFAWELVTKNFGLPAEKLCVTVHTTDEEAAAIWKKVTGFPDNKIIRINSDDNFWRMGDTGPCGPCTEIFYDHGDHIPGGPPGSPGEDGDRFIEIWNNVFMQYEQVEASTRIDLPAQSVDTGMGLERVAATLMGSNNNYDIDIMRAIIEHSADLTHYDVQSPSHKVVADHLRASAFLMADGVMPSNEGRGYVLRRIMRRAMRHAQLMGAKEPLMYRLLPTLISKMGEAYPELKRAGALVTQTLRTEEDRFRVTLERGLKMLDEESANLKSGGKFPGDVAFRLYDTYGFPLDLTQDALKSRKIEVDTAAFEACMEEQKKKARAAWTGSGEAATEKLWFEILDQAGPTEFLGYDKESAEGVVLAIVKDSRNADAIAAGEEGILITNQTPFYGESGGQVGDTGEIISGASRAVVTDTKKQLGKLWLHIVKVEKGEIKKGAGVELRVDTVRRASIKSNHSATHLLHEALREILGEHVAQKGSLQDAERTRFDVSHPQGLTQEELEKVEAIVNEQIRAGTAVETRLMALEDARASGAMALFGEKYDDEVRVVSMGTNAPGANRVFSIELCGGTHVKNTGDIGRFKIVSEGALSSGIRRLEAITGARVEAYEQDRAARKQSEADNNARLIKSLEEEIVSLGGTVEAIGRLLAFGGTDPRLTDKEFGDFIGEQLKRRRALEKQRDDLRLSRASQNIGDASEARDVAGVKFLGKVLEGFPAKDLKPMADDMKRKIGSGVVVLVATEEGKASIVVGVTDDLTARINAVDLVKIGAEALGGKGGGGRPDMAQAGGPDAGAANDGIAAIERKLAG